MNIKSSRMHSGISIKGIISKVFIYQESQGMRRPGGGEIAATGGGEATEIGGGEPASTGGGGESTGGGLAALAAENTLNFGGFPFMQDFAFIKAYMLATQMEISLGNHMACCRAATMVRCYISTW